MGEAGWWGLLCWNGLSAEQRKRLVEWGNLPMGYRRHADGPCKNVARVSIETQHDVAPGPRFYCLPCAIAYLLEPPAALEQSPLEQPLGTPLEQGGA